MGDPNESLHDEHTVNTDQSVSGLSWIGINERGGEWPFNHRRGMDKSRGYLAGVDDAMLNHLSL
jgi:hypothetical protein